MNAPTSRLRLARLRAWCALALAGVAVLVACGGGVETGGTGATAVTYAEGPITGFGSIIVGGVHFDESAARIEDADGSAKSRSDLRLGMVVQVESGALATDAGGGRTGTASNVRVGAQLLGPITALDLAHSRIDVLGQVVRLSSSTVLDGVPGGVSSLTVGSIVEVQGFFDADAAASNYVATRVDLHTGVAPTTYRVRGVALQVNATARTLSIGTQAFELGTSGLPPGLVDGAFVRLGVQTTPVNGRWLVVYAAVETRSLPDRNDAEVEGLVTSFTSTTRFSVNGIAVDASGAQVPAGLALGARVRVTGRSTAGVMVATSVSLRSDDDAYGEGVELRDLISSIDTVGKTFVLRGVTVFYGATPAPQYTGGGEADLANGRQLSVSGTLDAARTHVVATRIAFINP